MPGMLERLLETVPFSASQPGFGWLVMRAVDATESPLIEQDLRMQPATPAELLELVRDQIHADTALEAQASWDVWVFETASGKWVEQPQPLLLLCCGEEYDNGVFQQFGHFQADVGFEHLFTGHGGLLSGGGANSVPEHPIEAEFLAHMAVPENLREYREKTRQNIRLLMDWMQRIVKDPGVARCQLWSEGEENLEARLDEILARR